MKTNTHCVCVSPTKKVREILNQEPDYGEAEEAMLYHLCEKKAEEQPKSFGIVLLPLDTTKNAIFDYKYNIDTNVFCLTKVNVVRVRPIFDAAKRIFSRESFWEKLGATLLAMLIGTLCSLVFLYLYNLWISYQLGV